ncbi:MAG: trypsin-like peptidase domain-containing protein [Azoarcus sp.]|jgi:uncharacterized repeat protein (TIGR02543 family)|nr:trypsin-like peptidase domain-containing protein [Azoarcus sp.]
MMRSYILRPAILGLVSLVCAGNAVSASAGKQVYSVEAVSVPETGEQQQAQFTPETRAAVFRGRRIELAPLDSVTAKSLLAAQEADKSTGRAAVPRQIGFAREVPALENPAAAGGQLAWQAQADGGQAAVISIASPGAAGIRLGVRIFSLPGKAVLRVRAPGDAEAFEASGEEILDLIEANAASGDNGEAAYTWWTPVIETEEAALEIILPPGVPSSTVEIALPTISHLFASARTGWKATGAFAEKAAALSCHHDASCYAEWDMASRATALLTYVEEGKTYICSGTLLNDSDKTTFVPYFLTANHCISTQTVASTLVTYWSHRSPSCDGSGYDANRKQLAGGATLLYQAESTDTSFLQLKSAPPGGVVYAGWLVGATATDLAVAGIHSPGGDRLKIAFGSVAGLSTRPAELGGVLRHPSGETRTHIKVDWSDGATEGGSSGSGLFDSARQKFIGQLHGGDTPVACSGNVDYYGRFDLAYYDKLHEYLNPAAAQSFRLDVTRAGSGAVSGEGIDCGDDCTEQYASGTKVTLTATPASGHTFAGWSGACTGSATTCTVTVNADVSVTATFQQAQAARRSLSVQRSGSGTGTVIGQGITCGADCTEQYTAGTKVTLFALPASGHTFTGWSGACTGSTAICTVTMNADTSVTATFTAQANPASRTLSVRRSGILGGSVSGPGINCGSDCTEQYASGSQVTLTAKLPLAGLLKVFGYSFTGWGGACASAKAATTCTLKLDADASVTATFGW